jgi:uracil-DNA glycosylase
MGGQGQSGQNEDARRAEALLAFWADAGVEASYAETPQNRLVRPEKPKPTSTPISGAVKVAVSPDIAAAVDEARSLAAGADSLEALAAAIAEFNGCSLKFEGARQAVFCRGSPTADVMVIGEGPGADEDVRGLPFVGKAGQLLDKMLAAAGLTERVFITNTVYWRPPGNRTPTVAEQAVCRPFLEKAISLVNPKALLLAGGASAKSLLGRDEGILSLRGRWFEWADGSGTLNLPALPTLHPAFLLRTPSAKKKAWGDLLTLVERLDRPDRAP